jgi:YHS domain-containing protein
MNRWSKIGAVGTAAAVTILAGCGSGAGRCVGAAGIVASHDSEKVLLNLDKDGLAIQGYDPVAYFTVRKAVKGDPKHRSTHRGAVYQFATPDHKVMFDAHPAKYAPEFGGYCAYAASINAISPIDPAYWEVVDGRLLLQHNQKAWDLWHKDAPGNIVKADRNWPGLVNRNGAPPRILVNVNAAGLALEGFDPTSYILDGAPRRGDPSLARTYQGATYHFVDIEHKNAFEQDPARYVPKFGGFCGYAASINKVSPVNPEIWQLVDGRLVLQHTPRAFELFNEDAAANNAKADRNWPGLTRRRCN